jgi:hypothetical protein
MIQWKECDLVNATHVEINGEVHELKEDGKVKKAGKLSSLNYRSIEILIGLNDWKHIHVDLFPILGIKCLRKFKPTPSEFEAVFVKHDGQWRQLLTIDDGISIQNCKVARFRCVEILEEEK